MVINPLFDADHVVFLLILLCFGVYLLYTPAYSSVCNGRIGLLTLLAGAGEPADYPAQTLKEVTVADGENPLGHLHGTHTARHFGDAPGGHIYR